jgi:hypothetical protein
MKKRVSKRANRKIRGKSRKQKSMRNKKIMLGGIEDTGYCSFEEYLMKKLQFTKDNIARMSVFERNQYKVDYDKNNKIPEGCVTNTIEPAHLRVDGNTYLDDNLKN